MSFEARLARVLSLRKELERHREVMSFPTHCPKPAFHRPGQQQGGRRHDRSPRDVREAAAFLSDRVPLRGPGSRVALMLAYNGSAWLSTAITSIYLVGNRVDIKFSSKGSDVMRLTEEMYRPVFGDAFTFYKGSGRVFLSEAFGATPTSPQPSSSDSTRTSCPMRRRSGRRARPSSSRGRDRTRLSSSRTRTSTSRFPISWWGSSCTPAKRAPPRSGYSSTGRYTTRSWTVSRKGSDAWFWEIRATHGPTSLPLRATSPFAGSQSSSPMRRPGVRR